MVPGLFFVGACDSRGSRCCSTSATSSLSIQSIKCPMKGISSLQGLKLDAAAMATIVHSVTSLSVFAVVGVVGWHSSRATCDKILRCECLTVPVDVDDGTRVRGRLCGWLWKLNMYIDNASIRRCSRDSRCTSSAIWSTRLISLKFGSPTLRGESDSD